MNSTQNLKQAMSLWHEGKIKQADLVFMQLYKERAPLDSDALQHMSAYFLETDMKYLAFQCAKDSAKKQVSDKNLGIFLTASFGMQSEAEELNWLLSLHGILNEIEKVYAISLRLNELGRTAESYFLAVDLIDRIEHSEHEQVHHEELYINLLLHLIKWEFNRNDKNQARFQLRKLIFLQTNSYMHIDQLLRWTWLLDLQNILPKRSDYSDLEAIASVQNQLFLRFYRLLNNQQIATDVLQDLEQIPTQDADLKAKADAVIEQARFFLGQPMNEEKIVSLYDRFPTDFLFAKMYSMIEKHLPEDFWVELLKNHVDLEEAVQWHWHHTQKQQHTPDLDNCRVLFLGGGEKIGGTSILLTIHDRHLLLDAGMFINEKETLLDFSQLAEHELELKDLDAVIVSHAHVDHTGSLPLLHKQAPEVPLHMTDQTADLVRVLLSGGASRLTGTRQYEQVDVDGMLSKSKRHEFRKTFTVPAGDSFWEITLYEAGHILGAACIHIVKDGISVLFTGDFSIDPQRSCPSMQLPEELHTDILITESTYGYTPSNSGARRELQEQRFVEVVKRMIERDGTIILPAFAVGRAQEVLLLLKEAFSNELMLPFNVVVDGKAVDVCHLYNGWSGLGLLDHTLIGKEFYGPRMDVPFEEFLEQYVTSSPTCIIASSGMLNEGSSSAQYAEKLMSRSDTTIAFTGYLSSESPASKLMRAKYQSDATFLLNAIPVHVNGHVESLRLSAHASREQIVGLIHRLQPARTFLMHGEHTRRYTSSRSTMPGELVYPSVVEIMNWTSLHVTCAFNQTAYSFKIEDEKREINI